MIGHDDQEVSARLEAAIASIKKHGQGLRSLASPSVSSSLTVPQPIWAEDEGFRKRFREAADRLRERTLRDFREQEWPHFQRLNESLHNGWGLPVAALSICGHGTAEIRFTKLLGWYLDHRHPHGLGGLLGKALGEGLLGKEHPSPSKCEVDLEVCIGTTTSRSGHQKSNWVDLCLVYGDVRIYIEQKIGSAEGNGQLRDYADCLADTIDPERDRLVFLTPEGKNPSDGRWQALSYRELLGRLAQVLRRHALSPMARYNLKALLWDLMLGPIAQSPRWLNELRAMVAKVAEQPDREYINLSRWMARYNLGPEERRILLDIAEV